MKFHRKNPTTISSWALAIAQTLDASGYDSKALLKQAGIDGKTLINPDKRIKLTKMTRLWELARIKSNDPSFGLSVARNVSPKTFAALGSAVMASNNLDDVFKRTQRFYKIISNALEIRIFKKEERVSIGFIPYEAGPTPSMEAMDSFLGAIILFSHEMRQTMKKPLKIEMVRPKPENINPYYDIFGSNIVFLAPFNRITLEKSDLNIPFPAADSKVAHRNDQIVIEYLERFDRTNIVKKVHGKLIDLLPLGEPSLGKLAKEIGMSRRSLNRYLQNENVTYREILSEIRQHLAEQYLSENIYSIIEIAFKLGYTDSSNFSRAFKRWAEVTPREYRHVHHLKNWVKNLN
ncbi:MAG: AraC family transcriptional regulator [Desulfobacteraceae bacterium]|nr:AraC family transcriptional regulator [Desulfobacteraceae bacterium]